MKLESFLLVDRIEALDDRGGQITCSSDVPAESIIYENHFPGHPVVPGVMLLEVMAQTAGLLVLIAEQFDRMPFMVKVRSASFRRFVLPGQMLTVNAQRLHEGNGYAVMKTEIRNRLDDEHISSAQLMFRILPFPSPDFRAAFVREADRAMKNGSLPGFSESEVAAS